MLELARTLSISTEVSDCGSTHLVPIEVTTKKVLKKLNGKYYKLNKKDDLSLLNSDKDTHLIGKTVWIRSIVTCALHGDEVCPRCVGNIAVINADIADGCAGFESEEISKHVNQGVLSTKHLLTTNSEVIEFNDLFNNFLVLSGGEIYPNVNNNEIIQNIDEYGIYIKPEELEKVEELDEYSLYNSIITSGRFFIRNLKNPSEKDIPIFLKDPKEIFVSDVALKARDNKGIIKFKDLDDDDKLFEIDICNNELTKPLYSLMNLINKANKEEVEDNIPAVLQKFIELIIEAGIGANVVATEMITNRLIRDAYNIYERPDFSQDEEPEYVMLTVAKALEKHKSPTVGLSSQYLERQILSEELFEKRDGTSYLDAFFKEEISTDNLKTYDNIVRGKYKHETWED